MKASAPSCIGPGCSSGQPVLIQSRRLCSPCYQRLKKTDAFVPTRDTSTYHRITEVDPESRVAVCSICGPTTVVSRGYHQGKQGPKPRWRCAVWQERVRICSLKREYNLTSEQHRAMIEAQDGRCAICRKPEGDGRELSVDHCHQTGRPRGLLCWQCNTAIGKLGDTVEGVRAALAYLEDARRVRRR